MASWFLLVLWPLGVRPLVPRMSSGLGVAGTVERYVRDSVLVVGMFVRMPRKVHREE
jgi:hypothetical protein